MTIKRSETRRASWAKIKPIPRKNRVKVTNENRNDEFLDWRHLLLKY